MFCMHCGKPTEGDQTVCPQCAAQQAAAQAPQPVAEPAPAPVFEQPAPQQPVWQEAPQQPVYQQPVYQQPAPQADTFVLNTPETAGKKKKKNGLLIAIIALITAAAVVVGGIIGWPYIANWFNKTTSTPKEYNSNALTSTLANKDGTLITTYSQLRQLLNTTIDPTNMAMESDLRLQMNEDMLTALLSAALADTDFDAEDLAFLADISLHMTYNAKGSGLEIALIPVLGDTGILTFETGLDFDEDAFWVRIPELSSDYLLTSLYDVDLEDLEDTLNESKEGFATLSQIAGILPEEEVVIRLLEKYIPLALKQIDDVSEKEITLRTGSLEQKVTQTTSKIDQEAALKMAIACLKEAQKDKDIAAILADLSPYTGAEPEDILEQIPELVENLEQQLEEAEESDSTIDLITYTDAKGNSIGLSVEMNGTTFVNMFTLRSGDNFATAISFPEGEVELTAEGTDNKGVVSAEFVLEYQGMEMLKLTLIDFDTNTLRSGTIKLTPSDDLMDMALQEAPAMVRGLLSEISAEISFQDSAVSLALFSDGEELIRLTAATQIKNPTSVDVPSSGIDVNDEEASANWVLGWDYEAVLDNLRDGGVPGHLVDMVQQALEQAFAQAEQDTLPEGEESILEEEYEFNSTGKVVD